jgi:hypothetical protein
MQRFSTEKTIHQYPIPLSGTLPLERSGIPEGYRGRVGDGVGMASFNIFSPDHRENSSQHKQGLSNEKLIINFPIPPFRHYFAYT